MVDAPTGASTVQYPLSRLADPKWNNWPVGPELRFSRPRPRGVLWAGRTERAFGPGRNHELQSTIQHRRSTVPASFYARGTLGRDYDYRHSDRAPAPRGASGPRGRTADAVPQQHQATRFGLPRSRAKPGVPAQQRLGHELGGRSRLRLRQAPAGRLALQRAALSRAAGHARSGRRSGRQHQGEHVHDPGNDAPERVELSHAPQMRRGTQLLPEFVLQHEPVANLYPVGLCDQ